MKLIINIDVALEWHKGAIKAWIGASQIMHAAGKRAILSSQNSFKGRLD